MKKFCIVLCIATLLGVFETSAQNIPGKIEIWGNVSQSAKCKKNKKSSFGLYRIVVKDGMVKFTPLATGNKHYSANGGGIIYDGHCDFVNISGSGAELRSFNTLNWNTCNESGEDVTENNIITSAAAYDVKTNKVYACITDKKGKEHNYGYVDYDNYRNTRIGYNDSHYVAMAVDGEGMLFGIDIKGALHKIDKRSGKAVVIGSTGIVPSDNVQAMSFNVNDSRMYWAATTKKGNSFLCTVDTGTGAINKVCDFPDNDVISCMLIPMQPEAGAPSRLYDMNVLFEGALNKGNIFFTLPYECYDGTLITGEIDYDVMVDGKVIGSSNGKPGEKANIEIFIDDAGMHEFNVVLKYNGKKNVYNKISKWVGYDEPAPIRNLKYSTNIDKMVYLNWEAPRGGRHGGYIDRKNLVYKIIRNPGGLVIAKDFEDTHFVDDVSSGGNNGFYYEVTPYIKDNKK